MDSSYKKGLERNITIQAIFRTFNKRAYLPLIAIFAVSVADLSLAQFGLVASLSALVSLVMEIPSGYISDRMGHKRALILAHFLMMLAPLGYVFSPNFGGVLWGSAVYFGGFAFVSGTIEAFMHETLIALGRENEYARVVGKIQAVSLLANVIIIALVPLTYSIDPRLPFLIGSLLIGINFIVSFFLTTPRRVREKAASYDELSFLKLIKPILKTRQPILFLTLALAGASSGKILDFKDIYMQSLGVPIKALGFVAAIASLVAAMVSFNIHKLEKLPENVYYIFYFTTVFLITILAGFNTLPWLGVALIILLIVYDRNEMTLTRGYLLKHSPTETLKATYVSLLAFLEAVNGIWVPLFLGYLATTYGIRHGYAYFSIIILILCSLLFSWYTRRTKHVSS